MVEEPSGLIPSGLATIDFGLIPSGLIPFGLAIAAKLQNANNTSFNMFFALSGLWNKKVIERSTSDHPP